MHSAPTALHPDTGLFDRLSRASVAKHWEPYSDIPWDDPSMEVLSDDPRIELFSADPLASHPWYLAQKEDVRRGIARDRIASSMWTGIHFENMLSIGLLRLAAKRGTGHSAFRYAYHEIIEEGHHTLMFREFLSRLSTDEWRIGRLEGAVLSLAAATDVHLRPEAFFFGVLGGEEPIDTMQRRALREEALHPLLSMIFQIHVTEEARHVSFAKSMLRTTVSSLSRQKRTILSLTAPLILAHEAHLMLDLHPGVIRKWNIPASVIRQAYRDNPAWKQALRDSLSSTIDLARELSLITGHSRWVWKRCGLLPESPS